ncbi:histidinol-phosphatase (PHP family) [Anoxybacillus vitaminiphilus]|uniref:Histidinol-phosphatase n=1 Tax=Paranoxybacillus vitaminiphilus TaxID=581036 RepID=A0A327YJP1_9BACL|nr:histidinol-phosphatase HisJ [Anoxybacillus vitaminiphilus]RAK21224.1 histidinol-phosphatase (PHP family) [Anoxybacillus vitaminiphilus]
MKDGHIHTPFCPHGSKDSFEQYIERAIELGYTEISFTEHAPLPPTFTDPTPDQDSAMKMSDLDNYLFTVNELKKRYANDIAVNVGLEIDFIIGYEDETARLLEEIGPYLDDSILSVHFLNFNNEYFCLDYSPEMFAKIIHTFGSVTSVYETYYNTLRRAVTANLGRYKPKRIGHITLIHKFQKKFPCLKPTNDHIIHILDEMKKHDLEIDYNGAGVNKPLCREPYPPDWVIKEAMKRDIRIVYGSDAHSAKDLHQGIDRMMKEALSI